MDTQQKGMDKGENYEIQVRMRKEQNNNDGCQNLC